MALFPREHGAYGQVAFPALTAFAVAGVSLAGTLVASAVMAAFLGHEAAAVLLGLRGIRAQRERRDAAVRWLIWCGTGVAVAGLSAVLAMPAAARWSLAVPLTPALVLTVLFTRGHEKSWPGEVTAAMAFASAAVPISVAAGAPLSIALAVAVPFAALFIASTLAVRIVILKVRRGGDRLAVSATRGALLAFVVALCAGLAVARGAGWLPAGVVTAMLPGLAISIVLAAAPPAAARVRLVGWTLVAASTATAGIIIATLP